MAYASKSAAQGYTDFYKSNSNTSSSNTAGASVTGSDDNDVENSDDMTMVQRRKAALKKRLAAMKVSS
jgi:hypothetical protein